MRISYFIRNHLKPVLRKYIYYPLDIIDKIIGKNPLIPPRSMVFIGNGDFKKVGHIFNDYFIKYGGLLPNQKVLDIGCGIGRMALPLTTYLSNKGEYWGFDIAKNGVEWCNKSYACFSNFHFIHSDVYNQMYNIEGKGSASEYIFPFEDDSFDFCFLTSVFTHMLPSEVENYVKEISRVLKNGGKCLVTFFILNDESINLIQNHQSSIDIKHKCNGYSTVNPAVPEDAIGYPETWIISLFRKYNLEVTIPIKYGNWCGRDNYLSFQDIIIVLKNI